jgi:hypothetical protein
VRLLARDLLCQQAVELDTDYLEGALSRGGPRRFDPHLRACPKLPRLPGTDQAGRPAYRYDGTTGFPCRGKNRSQRALPTLAVRIARRDPNQALRGWRPAPGSDRESEVLSDAAGQVEVASEADRVEF